MVHVSAPMHSTLGDPSYIYDLLPPSWVTNPKDSMAWSVRALPLEAQGIRIDPRPMLCEFGGLGPSSIPVYILYHNMFLYDTNL